MTAILPARHPLSGQPDTPAIGFAGTAYGAPLTAKTANTAGSATTAGTAGNATNLNGLAAATYLDKAVQAASTGLTNVDNAVVTQVLNPTPLTVPTGVGLVRVDATVALSPVGNTGMAMWIQRDGPCIDSGADYEARQFGHTSTQDSITVTRLIAVTAGAHSFRMCVVAGADTSVDNRNMVVQTVALAS